MTDKQNQSNSEMSNNYNSRYVRHHLKPIMKSIYNNRKTVRLNGSLNGGATSTGINIMDHPAKDMAQSNV